MPINRRGEPARYLTDDLGREIRPGLEESALIQAAQQSYGRYSTLTIGDRDLEIALSTALPTEDASIEVDREFDIWADMGFLALPAVGADDVGVISTRFIRGPNVYRDVARTRICPSIHPKQLSHQCGRSCANRWQSTYDGVEQPMAATRQAYNAMIDGDAVTAAQLFADQQWRGSARSRRRVVPRRLCSRSVANRPIQPG